MNGIVIRRGYAAAEWGDTKRADMTFSVTKILSVDGCRPRAYARASSRILRLRSRGYAVGRRSLRLRTQPEDHLGALAPSDERLVGTLWDKPDWADRPPAQQTPEQWKQRELHEPGSFYKYNDTRVNVLALAALHIWKRPLPEVLRELVMNPIGASDTWHWEGYENSWVSINGRRMQSVSGGGHHGGGMFINAWDMARFGYLFLNNGQWRDKVVVPKRWIEFARHRARPTQRTAS